MDRFSEECIVLSSVDYGDADRIVTFLSLNRGRLSAFAAGARKSKKRFAGALEPGTHLTARLVDRGTMYRLDGVDVIDSFHHLRVDLGRISRAMYALELCRELVRDHEPHPQLFSSLRQYLSAIDEEKAGPTSLIAFELDTLAQVGFRPQFSPCTRCGGPMDSHAHFEADLGGSLCASCSHEFPYARRVDAEVLQQLHHLQRGARTPLPPNMRMMARDLLSLFIEHHIGRRMKSVDFLKQVGID